MFKLEAIIEFNKVTNCWDFWFVSRGNDRALVVKPIEFETEEVRQGQTLPPPTFSLQSEDGRTFLDSLKEQSFEGRSLNAAESELKATKLHLDDFRKLIFLRLKDDIEKEKEWKKNL